MASAAGPAGGLDPAVVMVQDWFCGAGGASEGIRQAGLAAVGFDFDRWACEAHHANGHLTVRADLECFEHRGTPRLVWASPPCQPWSNNGSELGAVDERDMIPAWLDGVERLRPPIVVMENVKGLTFEKNLPYVGWVLGRLERAGYRCDWRVLDAADYGVPQNRERLIIIARSDGGPIRWPAVTHTEHGGMFTEAWVTAAVALGRIGDDWWADRPATTIGCDLRVFLPGSHQANDGRDNNRAVRRADGVRVSLKELAVLQGFPPGYRFVGRVGEQTKQIGNAAPPGLVKAIVEALW